MKTELILCECSSPEHQIIIHKDEDYNTVYCSIHLNNYSFWKRLIIGVKYIFGYKSQYGAWDEIILTDKHKEQIKNIYEVLK